MGRRHTEIDVREVLSLSVPSWHAVRHVERASRAEQLRRDPHFPRPAKAFEVRVAAHVLGDRGQGGDSIE